MTLRVLSLDDKIAAIDRVINLVRKWERPPGSSEQAQYEALKALAADLRGRQQLPRSQTLGELTRLMARMKAAPREDQAFARNYSTAIVNLVVGRWATISQALEQFGEESAE